MSAATSRGHWIEAAVDLPHACDPEMLLLCFPPNLVRVERLQPPVGGIDRVACFQAESFLQVRSTRPAIHVDIELQSASQEVSAIADFADGTQSAPFPLIDDRLVIDHEGIVAVTVRRGAFCAHPGLRRLWSRSAGRPGSPGDASAPAGVDGAVEPGGRGPRTEHDLPHEDPDAGRSYRRRRARRWTNNLEQEEIACFRTEGAPVWPRFRFR